MLQEAVVCGDDAGADIYLVSNEIRSAMTVIVTVSPDARSCAQIWVRREERGLVVWVGFFEEFTQHGAFVEGLALVLQGRDETAGVQI